MLESWPGGKDFCAKSIGRAGPLPGGFDQLRQEAAGRINAEWKVRNAEWKKRNKEFRIPNLVVPVHHPL
jgi:hypothetical protein